MRAVITFHSIDNSDDVLAFPPSELDRLLATFTEFGIPILALNELLRTDRGVSITFDDGMASVAGNALPVLMNHRAPAHLFLTTSHVGGYNDWPSQPATAARRQMLSWHEADRCLSGGVLLECHTATHPNLSRLSEECAIEECELANETIEKRTGRRPRYFAYPYGLHNDRLAASLGSLFDGCFTTRLDFLRPNHNLSLLPRIDGYYLRGNDLSTRLETIPGAVYLRFRSILRSLRGSQ